MLEVGTVAPDFTLQDQNGEEHSLSDYRGKKVILYFYPKDNTAGCTKQACGFAELYPKFTEKGAVILGVSKDSVKSHKISRQSTIFHSRFFPIRSTRSLRNTMYGRKRRITARSRWALSGRLISLTKGALS